MSWEHSWCSASACCIWLLWHSSISCFTCPAHFRIHPLLYLVNCRHSENAVFDLEHVIWIDTKMCACSSSKSYATLHVTIWLHDNFDLVIYILPKLEIWLLIWQMRRFNSLPVICKDIIILIIFVNLYFIILIRMQIFG